MATINAFIRTTEHTKAGKEVNIRFRLTDGRDVQLLYKSSIKILPEHFDPDKQQYKARISSVNGRKVYDTNIAISETKQRIERIYNEYHPRTSAQLTMLMQKPEGEEQEQKEKGLFELYDMFLNEKQRTAGSLQTYNTLHHCLIRYEAYKRTVLTTDALDKEFVFDFERYMKDEWKIVEKRPALIELCPESRAIKPRGINTIAKQLKNLSAFLNWLVANDYMRHNPMQTYKKPAQVYGTPFFLTIEEREKIYNFDYATVGRAELNEARDVFVLQCLVACRVSDLFKLRRANVRGEFIEYIPKKTANSRARVVRVPLTAKAKEILIRYKDLPDGMILPLTYPQKYNKQIKDLVQLAGIDRMVTILDPQTRKEVNKPIYEVASSHMARRTFIGNLYNKVQDPNLISSMSGHAEGSRAFARYRAINDDVKKSVVNLLE